MVWSHSPSSGDRLLVLLALADFCNDEGECWPSQTSLAERSRCTKRGVQKIIDHLIYEKEIQLIDQGGGRGKSAKYKLKKYAKLCMKTVNDIHPNAIKGEQYSTNGVHPLQAERVNATTIKGEQLVHPNHKEPSKNHHTVKLPSELSVVNGFREAWFEFSSYRKKKKAPLTAMAANQILKRLSLRPEKSVGLLTYVMERGWQTFDEKWLHGTSFELASDSESIRSCEVKL